MVFTGDVAGRERGAYLQAVPERPGPRSWSTRHVRWGGDGGGRPVKGAAAGGWSSARQQGGALVAAVQELLVQAPLTAGADQVVLAPGGEAAGVPAEVALLEGVGGEARGQLQ